MIKIIELGLSVSEERHQHVGYSHKIQLSYPVNMSVMGRRDTKLLCIGGLYRTSVST